MNRKKGVFSGFSLLLLAATSLTSQAQLIWTVGLDDNGWPCAAATPCNGGGSNATFVAETGGIETFPGSPNSPETDRMADNDYYFAGDFAQTIPSVVVYYGNYTPVGTVAANEEAVERAFAVADNDLRYHFNLPDTLQPTDILAVTFDALNLHTDGQTDPRYGIEVYFNGVLVQPQLIIRPPQLGVAFTTPQFTLSSVNAQVGPGHDNVLSLKGFNYSAEGGGDWMGIDYVQLSRATVVIPPAVFPWSVGADDDAWPLGDGGGTNASFVQENGVLNPLPGSPTSPETDLLADNDYYFAGNYTAIIGGNGTYTPVGLVPVNEEAAERGFSGADNELRYHFNIPNTLAPGDLVQITFDALSLQTNGPADPRYGVEVYFNGVLVQPQVLIRPAQLGQTFTTAPFTLGSVNASMGAGFDNIISLRGISYSATGGGDSLGLDYVHLDRTTNALPLPLLPWGVGRNDDGWPIGDGGGTNASFLEGDGFTNSLPGNPANEEFDLDPDDDYYFAGAYTTVIPGNGDYVPAGLVFTNEEAAARGFAGTDNERRYHFNLPASLQPGAMLAVTFDALNLEPAGPADPRYGIEVYFNNVLVQTQLIIRPAQLGQAISTPRFTAGSVNARGGVGYDNIVRLRGINYSASGGSDSMGLDYIQLNVHPESPFPWAVGRDDNGWPFGDGGGPNTSFVQENGSINALPGRPNNPEVNQQGDNDYYFAGDYMTALPGVTGTYGPYTPIGSVLANEEGAERAFAAADNDLRYHFNLPSTLSSNDLLSVTFDAFNLDDPSTINTDPRYGIEVYFNGVLVQTQIVIRPAQLDVDYTTPPFTVASVDGRVGPGFDNIVSLKGINYNNEGGGNWMGIDYVQLNGPQGLQFLPPVVSGGQITLNWTGTGELEWAPTVLGPWTPITPVPTPPYSEAVVPGENRFFRLRGP